MQFSNKLNIMLIIYFLTLPSHADTCAAAEVVACVVAGVLACVAERAGGSGWGLKVNAGVAHAAKAITKNMFLVMIKSSMFVDLTNLAALD